MIEKLFPNQYLDSVYEMDIKAYKKMGINAMVFDIDNTLVPYFVKNADDKIKRFFSKIKKNGIRIGILSNNKKNRVDNFCEGLDVLYLHRAGKPGIKGLKKLLSMLNTKPENSLMAGDQVFTDIWCGNSIGMYTVLIKPIVKKDQFVTWIKRRPEKAVINLYLKRGTSNAKS